MMPWYAGFTGSIQKDKKEVGKCEVYGRIEGNAEQCTATITELPVGKWTQDYREFLEENLPKGEKKKDGVKLLEDYAEHHTEKTVQFELTLSQEGVKHVEDDTLTKVFKLKSSISLNNMMLFDEEGRIKKYETALDIIRDFARVRLALYDKRKAFLLDRLGKECEILSAKARFIKLILDKELIIKKRKILDLIQELRRRGFKALRETQAAKDESAEEAGDGGEEENEQNADDNAEDEEGEDGEEAEANAAASARKATSKGIKDFEYLVGMPISTLTAEKVEELMRQRETKQAELDTLKKKSIKTLWEEDLSELETLLDERDAKRAAEDEKERARIQKAKAKNAGKERRSASAGERGRSGSAGATRGTKRTAPERAPSAPAPAQKRGADEASGDGSRGRGRPRKS